MFESTSICAEIERDSSTKSAIFFLLFLIFWGLSGISPVIFLRRLAMILPLGIFLIVFQVFFENRFYPVFHPIITLPFGIHIYAESMEFALILL